MADELQRRKVIDPSTADILEGLEKKRSDSRRPRREREKISKEREKAKARLPHRVNWDIPLELKNRIVDFADGERIPASQVVSFLLFDELNRLRSEAKNRKITLERYIGEYLGPYKTPSNSPRYDWNLTFPQEN